MTKTAFLDTLARAGWTALQSALGVLAVTAQTDLPQEAWWAVPVASVLSALKSFVASRVGDPHDVSFTTGHDA